MPNSSNIAFSITDAQIHFAFVFSKSCTIPGTCVCFLVLILYGGAGCFPRSRRHMDRVSFRLLIYALIFHVLFGISYAAAPILPGKRCDFAAFCSNLFLCFSTFFTTCIAINLQLVVVHHVNGQRMEKYYLIGSILLSLVFNVPALAFNQFGWDKSTSNCWYKNPDRINRLRWMIATESLPVALAAIIEAICSCVLLVYMYLVQGSMATFKFTTSSIKSTTKATDVKRIGRRRQSMDITQHPQYRKAILRIVLYPIISLLVNFLTVALDLNGTIRGVNNQLDFRLLILGERRSFVELYNRPPNIFKSIDLSLVGMRTLPYGLLAAVDPAFIAAVRELLGKNESTSETTSTLAPIEFIENSQKSLCYSQGTSTTFRVGLNIDRESTSNVVEENINEDEERIQGVEMTESAQDLESNNQYDDNLEPPVIKRQL